jgi:hypothetical protein
MSKESEEVATAVCMVIDGFGDIDVRAVLVGLGAVLTTLIAETDMSEEDAIEGFTKSLKASRERIKDLTSKAH